MSTLYELKERYVALCELAFEQSDDEGRLSDEFVAMLNSLEGEMRDKVEATCKVMKNLEATIAGLKSEEQRLQAKRANYERRVMEIKDRLRAFLTDAGTTKYDAGTFTVSLQVNGGRPAVVLDDEDAIPKTYYIQPPPVLSKEKILADIESGKEVPGVHTERGTHIRVR